MTECDQLYLSGLYLKVQDDHQRNLKILFYPYGLTNAPYRLSSAYSLSWEANFVLALESKRFKIRNC